MHGRVDAGGDGDDPGDDEREQGEHHGQHEPLADQLGVRTLVFERQSEIAAQEVLHPFEVLHPHRPVEAEFLSERLDLLGADRASRRREGGHVRGEEVARGRLHDRENGYREEEEENGEQEETLENESSQLTAPSLGEAPIDPPASTTAYLRTMYEDCWTALGHASMSLAFLSHEKRRRVVSHR